MNQLDGLPFLKTSWPGGKICFKLRTNVGNTISVTMKCINMSWILCVQFSWIFSSGTGINCVNGSIHVAVQFPEYVQMTGSWHAKRFIGCWVCYTLRVIYPERIRKIFLKRFVLNLKRFQLLNQRVLGFILKDITGNVSMAW